MLSLILLSLLGSAWSAAVEYQNQTVVNFEHYRLNGQLIPTRYDVRLFFNPNVPSGFDGDVSIRFLASVTTNRITLHAMAMEIQSIQLFPDGVTTPTNITNYEHTTNDTHFLTMETAVNLNAGTTYVLNIVYRGTYATDMFGVYISTYQHLGQTRNLIATQLQPTFARRAFPCFDEPRFKAIFRTTIYAPAQFPVVRSNMPIRATPLQPEVPGFVKHEFDDTPVMSTYLLAYLVSDFTFVSNEGVANPIYRVPFRIYSRPGTESTAQFALNFGQENMVALEEYTNITYALPKFDKAAIPDFAAGAMENWGLVLYREVALLYQEGVTTTSTLQNIGRIICHENVHMWFGNEVSPLQWTYTWLNEGFANFFENYGTDLVLPEWRMMDQYVLLLQNVMQSDAVLEVNPMTHPVYTPSQIIGTFNAVAYQKSGSVIRMMQHFLTPEVFRDGLILYLNTNRRTSVGPPQLYQALQTVLDASNHSINWPIATIMERWTTQGGFPVLTVRRSAPSANSLFVTQQRFLTDTSLVSHDRWHIPINWVLSTNPDFSNTIPQIWMPAQSSANSTSIDIPTLSQAEWYIINKQQTGYYRVNYDDENWQALANALIRNHSVIHLLNRAQIVDDAFNLARNGRLNYRFAFELSSYLINETDYIAWGAANAAFTYLDVVLSGSPAYQLFQRHILTLSEPLYNKLGFTNATGEEHVTAFHRNIILNLNCRYGNEDCVSTAQTLLESVKNDGVTLHPDVQNVVFCSGLRGGSVDNFNFLWDRYLGSQDSSEQSILLNALGCISNSTFREFYLNQVIAEDSRVREQDRHTILVSVINSSPEGTEAGLDFVVANFAQIQPRVQGLTGTTNILNALARRLTTAAHSTKINTFATQHDSILSAGERASLAAIRENIAASITWTSRNYDIVNGWLDVNYGSNANIVTSSFIIIISVIMTLYNS